MARGSRIKLEAGSGREDAIELLPARELRKRLRYLHCANVVALAVVRAALGYQHRVAVLEILDRRDAFQKLGEIALLPRKENRKRSQANIAPRDRTTHLGKRLRVGDD